LAFDPYLLLLIIFCCFFVPGILISIALLKGTRLNIFEKSIIGLGLGFSVPQLFPFLLFFFFGIKYTYDLALATVAVWWLLAIALSVWKRIDSDLLDFTKQVKSQTKESLAFYCILILIAFVVFWIRLSSYSPVFQELDPYYYTYIAQQILVFGYNPLNDQTAWWPVVEVSHRVVPVLSYMESLWYSLYNGSNQYNNMLLAVIASVYPPIAAMLAFLFFYLLLSRITKREYALAGAAIASFTSMFMLKTMAGEMEVQPYAFFAISFFYALYFLTIKEKNRMFAVIAAIAYTALALGSASEILALTVLSLAWLIFALILFYKNEDAETIRKYLELNAIVLIIGPVLASGIIKNTFYAGHFAFSSTNIAVAFIILVLLAVLYIVQGKKIRQLEEIISKYNRSYIIAALALLLFVFLLSPLGEPIKAIGRTGFGVVEYQVALSKTIAEQGMAGHDFGDDIGFVAADYSSIAYFFFSPLADNMSGSEGQKAITDLANAFASGLGIIFIIFTILGNLFFALLVKIINFVLSSNATYDWKSNSLVMFWPVAFLLASIYYLYKNKNENSEQFIGLVFLFVIVFPVLIVGLIKAKYTIYAGFFLGGAIAFVFEAADDALKKYKLLSDPSKTLAIVAAVLLLLQFLYSGIAPGLLAISFETRFQDNPLAVKDKLDYACKQSGDATICAAAADPMGYAKLGTNQQYNYNLCLLSTLPYDVFSKPSKSPNLYRAALLRCSRVADYWISSMEWIRYNTEPDSRTISWWDYGHWINFFGQKNTVLRNEHASLDMIYRVAFTYTEGNETDLIEAMKDYGSKYALFDIEILAGNGGFGAKYGALNYLGCNYVNRTNVSSDPGQSDCERENLWETLYGSPNDLCVISQNPKKVGFVASRVLIGPPNGEQKYSPYYPGECVGQINDERIRAFCSQYVRLEPVYCVGEVELADGTKTTGTYYLNETYPNGDLKLNKALLVFPSQLNNVYQHGQLISFTTVYTKQKIWLENGQIVDGYEDRKGHFYDSNIYKALVLKELDGFDKVYDNGAVVIYKIKSE